MSVQTTTRLTTLPRVNLLPPEIEERKRLQQVQVGVVLGIVLAVGGVGFFYYQGRDDVATAKKDVAAAVADNAKLTRTIATYRDVKTTAAQLAASEAMLSQAMSTEIRWSGYLSDFGFLPKNTWLSDVTMTSSLTAGSLPSSKQAPADVGSLSFKGVALKYGDMADWLDALQQPKTGISNVSFTNAAEAYIGDTKVINFTAAADLTANALSNRCAEPGSC